MSTSFPNETSAYRTARNNLLTTEIELRKQLETIAALRRELPNSGAIPEDYVFDKNTNQRVRLSELFKAGQQTLLIYNFMFGPKMPAACALCTSILDGLDGTAPHVMDQVSFAVVAKSPIGRIRDYAKERGWRNLRLLSSASNSYNHDYHGETEDGSQMPMLNVFVRREGKIHHFYGTEMLFAPRETGQDARHVDLIWPLWSLIDLTPEGRGKTWRPKLKYE
jgi:predicted dithiol-disulfide oxidoreductase (DUF899 family)